VKSGVVVYCIGAGTSQGSIFKEAGSTQYMTDENGNTVISRLNESLLKNIASITGGNFFLLNDQMILYQALKKEFSNFEEKHPGTGQDKKLLFILSAVSFCGNPFHDNRNNDPRKKKSGMKMLPTICLIFFISTSSAQECK
jgi:hypothetical protein